VLAHEEKLGMTTGEEVDTEEVLVTIYEAPDGFRGTYDEVLAHEKKLGMATGSEHTALNEDDGQIYMVNLRTRYFAVISTITALDLNLSILVYISATEMISLPHLVHMPFSLGSLLAYMRRMDSWALTALFWRTNRRWA